MSRVEDRRSRCTGDGRREEKSRNASVHLEPDEATDGTGGKPFFSKKVEPWRRASMSSRKSMLT